MATTDTPINLLWSSILRASPLAKLLAHIFDAISSSRIAHVPISKNVETSLQIPHPTSTPYAPTPSEPQLPGLWLTTASMVEDDDGPGTSLSPHAALLLLEDKDTLLKQIEKDNHELAPALAFFIRELTPTKSLHKLAGRLSLRLPDLQFLARHLIYWRRARAIPPLHIRDTYILSPNADMRGLGAATAIYERRFTGLPSLPRMLQALSARPVQYGLLVPSQDHKVVYLDMLAWLLRGGWVTQLRTFAWVRVSPEIKAKVGAARRQEEIKAAKEKAGNRLSVASGGSSSAANTQSAGNGGRRTSRSESIAGLLSPMMRSVSLAANAAPAKSDSASVSSSRTTIQPRRSPLTTINDRPDAPSPLSMGPTSSALLNATAEDSLSAVPPLSLSGPAPAPEPKPQTAADFEPTLVLDPYKATAEEARWLAAVGQSVGDAEVKEAWSRLVRYFDGRTAMEDVGAREGWKRSKVAGLMARLEREGVLCVVRHW